MYHSQWNAEKLKSCILNAVAGGLTQIPGNRCFTNTEQPKPFALLIIDLNTALGDV